MLAGHREHAEPEEEEEEEEAGVGAQPAGHTHCVEPSVRDVRRDSREGRERNIVRGGSSDREKEGERERKRGREKDAPVALDSIPAAQAKHVTAPETLE